MLAHLPVSKYEGGASHTSLLRSKKLQSNCRCYRSCKCISPRFMLTVCREISRRIFIKDNLELSTLHELLHAVHVTPDMKCVGSIHALTNCFVALSKDRFAQETEHIHYHFNAICLPPNLTTPASALIYKPFFYPTFLKHVCPCL